MPWNQLKSIADAQRDWARRYYAQAPTACPYDGTPLETGYITGPGGGKTMMLHCPMGNYSWTGGTAHRLS